MKNFIITLLAVFATATAAMALPTDKTFTMHVNTADGKTVDYKFSMEPVVTFNEGEMTIASFAKDDLKLVIDNVTNITFTYTETSAIANTLVNGSNMKISATAGGISITGMKPNGKVAVFDASGKQVAAAYSDANGNVSVDMGNSGKGVFVVNTPDNSFKFIK